MRSGRVYTLAILIFMLIAPSVVSASPTVFSDCSLFPVSVKSDNASSNSTCIFNSGVVDKRIAELANDFLQPPASFDSGRDGQSNNSGASSAGNIFLPTVPPALFMVLTGFFCISLVRDRRAWIAVVAGLLWLGQAGFNALPELTSRLSRKTHNCSPVEPELLSAYPLSGAYFPESFNEQIRYTGLLHHLEGIPRRTGNLTKFDKCFSLWSPHALRCNFTSQHAIIASLSLLNTDHVCLVRPTGQYYRFTPAFTFNLIPRGPPIPS